MFSCNRILLLSRLNSCSGSCRFFKSRINSEVLFGSSSVEKEHPDSISNTNVFSGYLPMNQLQFSYCRSSGPGGQNVNKVNSKVELRFHLDSAIFIPEEAKQRLRTLCSNRITKSGEMVITSDRTRKQMINKADCIDQLRSYIFEACKPLPTVSPQSILLAKERAERASLHRLKEKRIRGEVKLNRQSL